MDSLLNIYTKCLKDRKSCRKLKYLLILCSGSSPILLFFLYTTLFLFLFISLFHCLFHLSPSWIIAILTCFVQSTQTYFLWCLPAAWLSLAHPSSAKAPVFLLITADSSRVRWNQMVPSLIQAFPGSPEQHVALSPLHPPVPCHSLALPAWFRRSWEGSEWPGAQVGAILWIFIISFNSSLCSGEYSEATDILQRLKDSSQGDHVNCWTPKQGWVCVCVFIFCVNECVCEHGVPLKRSPEEFSNYEFMWHDKFRREHMNKQPHTNTHGHSCAIRKRDVECLLSNCNIYFMLNRNMHWNTFNPPHPQYY